MEETNQRCGHPHLGWSRWAAAMLVCGAAMIALVPGVFLAGPVGAAVRSETYTFTKPSTPYQISIPSTLTRIRVTVDGATGDSGQGHSYVGGGVQIPGAEGGAGGRVAATLVFGHGFSAGNVLEFFVGSSGDSTPHGNNPLSGGKASRGGIQVAQGGDGGGGSGVYNETRHQWLVVAGGGGGGGGIGHLSEKASAGGTPDRTSAANCPELDQDPARTLGGDGQAGGTSGGGGGGGGGGCYGGPGGSRGTALGPGAPGAAGRNWNFADAHDVSVGTAPRGNGSITATLDSYGEPPPEIVTPREFTLTVGQPANVDVLTIGKPPPSIIASGQFPAGTRFHVPLFSGNGELRGTPEAGSEGTYTIAVTAENEWGKAAQRLTLVVRSP